MKTMVIVPGLKYYYFNGIESDNVFVKEERYVSEKSKWKSLVQQMSKRANLPFVYRLFMRSWIKDLHSAGRCIIFDQAISFALVKSLRSINPGMPIYIYCWNPISKNPVLQKKLESVSRFVTAIYSFDKDECNKYGFRFAPMVYDFEAKSLPSRVIKYDVCFVGYLKARGDQISELYTYLTHHDYTVFFYVLDHENTNAPMPFPLHKEYLGHREYMNVLSESKAVLDITQPDQRGLTIRALETMYYQKKLITNNKDIVTYDFYNPENIFILGEDSLENFHKFLSTPFVQIERAKLKKYNFVDWVNDFNE